MTTIEVLKKARELVARPGGWRQREYGTQDRCCLLGALNLATGAAADDDDLLPADSPYRIALGQLEAAINAKQGTAHKWNDAPGRTQAEVVEAFDRAIALAEAKGR